jgi:hypothetical protein
MEEAEGTINFSHYYKKFPFKNDSGKRKARLIQVFTCEAKELSTSMIVYDSTYLDKNGEPQLYDLPTGKVLVLLLQIFPEIDVEENYFFKIFTTIRRWTSSKAKYYYDSIGKVFDLKIAAD